MKSIKRNVYSCDFCKKYLLTKQAMKKHEKHCFKNPKWICPCCDNNTEDMKRLCGLVLKEHSFQDIVLDDDSESIGKSFKSVSKCKPCSALLRSSTYAEALRLFHLNQSTCKHINVETSSNGPGEDFYCCVDCFKGWS